MTRVACISDIHENLPEIPECEILCIAGDLTFGFKGDLASQQKFLINEFAAWCREVPAKHIVVVAGNHDQCIERWGWPAYAFDRNVYYLQDTWVTLEGVKLWGTPWQPWFYGWGFNAPEGDRDEFFLEHKFSMIHDDTDMVICHGPPRGYGDTVGDPNAEDRFTGQPRVGSMALTRRLREVRPKLMVCGHIHSGRGEYTLHDRDGKPLDTKVVNCAVVDNSYKAVYQPYLYILD